MIYKVKNDDTLLHYLITNTSKKRNDIKNALKYKKVFVNGEIVTQFDYLIHINDQIEIRSSNTSSIDIIYEDDEFIVINKPCGLLSERTHNESTKTAFNYVNEYLKKKREKAYLVHRLDQYTSGVLMFVKKKNLYDLMTHHWNDLVLDRNYIGVVEGTLKDEGHIETYLYESSSQLVKVSKDKGKKAITNYKVLKSNKHYSLLDIHILTGRKNQIRVHMSYIHHPIIGDDKYGHKSSPIKRLGLHANSFTFKHPINHKKYTFKTDIPNEFNQLFIKG